jgi:aldose 1-epimerase
MASPPAVFPFGSLSQPDGAGRRDVEVVALHSSALTVEVMTLGATLWTVEAPDRLGHRDHVALHLPTLADVEDRGADHYLGTTCGRVAGRISGSAFELDGQQVEVAPNEGENHLHGGPDGFHRRIWDLVEVAATDDGGRVVLALTSPDGDQGYPGTLAATATYELRGHVCRLTYEAVTDAPTVVNLTNHAYWNLGGPTRWDLAGSVGDHELRLPAGRYQPVDDATLPVGPMVAVDGTPHDLRQPRLLFDAMAGHPAGIDHAFEVPSAFDEDLAALDGLRVAAELHHPASGRTLTVSTDQPAVQVYTANLLGVPFASQAAVCLETQHMPDAPNRAGVDAVVLRPGEHHRATTELTFGIR